MAEALGLAASVLQLSQVAWTVVQGLYQLADEIGSAGESVRVFTLEFDVFLQTLTQLEKALRVTTLDRQAENTITDIVDITSIQILLPFRQLVDKLKPLLSRWRNSPDRMLQLGKRLQWAFSYKKKILFYRGALGELKTSVILLLQVIALRQSQQPLVYLSAAARDIATTDLSEESDERSRDLVNGHVFLTDEAAGLLKKAPVTDSASRMLLLHESIETNVKAITNAARTSTPMLGSDAYAATSRAPSGRSISHIPRGSTSGQPIRPTKVRYTVSTVDDTDDDSSQDELEDSSQAFADMPLLAEEQDQSIEDQMELWGAVRMVNRKVKQVVDTGLLQSQAPHPAPLHTTSTSRPRQSRNNWQEDRLSPQPSGPPTPASSTSLPRHLEEASQTGVRCSPGLSGHIYFRDCFATPFRIPLDTVRTWKAMEAFIKAELQELQKEMAAGVAKYFTPDKESAVQLNVPCTSAHQERVKLAIKAFDRQEYMLMKMTSKDGRRIYVGDGYYFSMAPDHHYEAVFPDMWEDWIRPNAAVVLTLDDSSLRFRMIGTPSNTRSRLAILAAEATNPSHSSPQDVPSASTWTFDPARQRRDAQRRERRGAFAPYKPVDYARARDAEPTARRPRSSATIEPADYVRSRHWSDIIRRR